MVIQKVGVCAGSGAPRALQIGPVCEASQPRKGLGVVTRLVFRKGAGPAGPAGASGTLALTTDREEQGVRILPSRPPPLLVSPCHHRIIFH